MTLKTSVKVTQVEKWYLGRKKVQEREEISVGIDVKNQVRVLISIALF